MAEATARTYTATDTTAEQAEIQPQLCDLNRRADNLIDLYQDQEIDRDRYRVRYAAITNEIEDLELKLKRLDEEHQGVRRRPWHTAR